MTNLPKLMIVAPSGAMESEEILPRAATRIKKLGFDVHIDPQAQAIVQRFAGSDLQRAEALKRAILDPNISHLMAARGGYGAHRLLPLLDWKKLAKAVIQYDKKIIGHSDFTAIQLALLRHGAPSFAGPCAGVDFGGNSVHTGMRQALMRGLRGDDIIIKVKQAQEFQAQGVLWGGNLAMICSLLGTPYFPKPAQISGGILFLEDTNERPFRVERMLNQLQFAGVLSMQSAVLWGDFGKPVMAEYDRGYGLASVLAYLRSTLSAKVATGLPIGHCANKMTLPFGAQVSLTVHSQGFEIIKH